jgi:hypothetical protein
MPATSLRTQIVASFRVIERLLAPSPACGGGLGRGRLRAFVPWNCPLSSPYGVDTSLRGTVVPLPACGERSDRAAIRVRGLFRESERQIFMLRIVERSPHPDPLPASGAREHIGRAICKVPTEMCPCRSPSPPPQAGEGTGRVLRGRLR